MKIVAGFVKRHPLTFWVVGALLLSFYIFYGVHEYWFHFESLGLLYVLQHPDLWRSVFTRPENIPYLGQIFLYSWQYKFFGYNALGYSLVSLGMGAVAIATALLFFRRLGLSRPALIIVLLFFASGLFGIETITVDPINGTQNYYVITLLFVILLNLAKYVRTQNLRALILAVSLYVLVVAFSQFRSFLLFFPIIFFLLFFRSKSLRVGWIVGLFTGITIAGFVPAFFWGKQFAEQGRHLISLGKVIGSGFGNVASSVVVLEPVSGVANPVSHYPVLNILIGVALTVVSVLVWRRNRETIIGKIIGYCALTTVANAALMGVMVGFSGGKVVIYQNAHRFLTFLTFTSFPLAGLFLSHLLRPALARPVRIFWMLAIAGLIFGQAYKAKAEITQRAPETRQFKEFFAEFKRVAVPSIDEGVVIQTIAVPPRLTFDPFNRTQFGPVESGIAGYYHVKGENVYLTENTIKSRAILAERGWGLDKLFVVKFSKDGIVNISDEVRDCLNTPKEFSIAKDSYTTTYDPRSGQAEPITFSNLNLPTCIPFELSFKARVTPLDESSDEFVLPIWWHPKDVEQWVEQRWSQNITLPLDGKEHLYTVTIIADEGEITGALKFGGVRDKVKIDIRNVTARYRPLN